MVSRGPGHLAAALLPPGAGTPPLEPSATEEQQWRKQAVVGTGVEGLVNFSIQSSYSARQVRPWPARQRRCVDGEVTEVNNLQQPVWVAFLLFGLPSTMPWSVPATAASSGKRSRRHSFGLVQTKSSVVQKHCRWALAFKQGPHSLFLHFNDHMTAVFCQK